MLNTEKNTPIPQYNKNAVIQSKIKVVHGNYTKEPKCKICNTDLSHEWLNGDYTLLVCDSSICLDKMYAMTP